MQHTSCTGCSSAPSRPNVGTLRAGCAPYLRPIDMSGRCQLQQSSVHNPDGVRPAVSSNAPLHCAVATTPLDLVPQRFAGCCAQLKATQMLLVSPDMTSSWPTTTAAKGRPLSAKGRLPAPSGSSWPLLASLSLLPHLWPPPKKHHHPPPVLARSPCPCLPPLPRKTAAAHTH